MLTDKPLSELWTYKGINPKPADFDDFWNHALAEVAATDPAPRLERADTSLHPRNAELFDLWFTGVGGARIYAKYVRPKNPIVKLPTILEFHGYTGSSSASRGNTIGFRPLSASVSPSISSSSSSFRIGSNPRNTSTVHLSNPLCQ